MLHRIISLLRTAKKGLRIARISRKIVLRCILVVLGILILTLLVPRLSGSFSRKPVSTQPQRIDVVDGQLSSMITYAPTESSDSQSVSEIIPSVSEILYTKDGNLPYIIGYVESPNFTAADILSDTSIEVFEVNGGLPFFEKPSSIDVSIALSDFDSLHRVGPTMVTVGPETIQHGDRGPTGQAKPTGWVQNKYEGIVESDPPYLYNRGHMAAMWALTGMTDEERNLVTLTRYTNATLMLDTELDIINYIETSGHHVQYRVTPIFDGTDLLARGLLMEAWSVEDDELCFCRFVRNIQPGIHLEYSTGENWREE